MNRRGFINMLGVTPAVGLLPKIKPEKKEVYFSDKGDDINGDGTWNKPYKTIGRALKENVKHITYIFKINGMPASWGYHSYKYPLKPSQFKRSGALPLR